MISSAYRFGLKGLLISTLLFVSSAANVIALEEQTQPSEQANNPADDLPAIEHVMSYEEAAATPVPEPPNREIESETLLMDAVRYKELIENKASQVPFLILPHKPNYLMPISYQANPYNEPFEDFVGEDEWQGLSNQEAAFQLSIKYKIMDLPGRKDNRLYVAYTNQSYWQVYNGKISRPFRETNHEPEIMAVFNPEWKYLSRAYVSLSHQSNGQYTQFSRSWNRIIFGAFHITGNSVVGITPWWRLPETQKADPEDPSDNDNPDIDDYMGYGEFIYLKMIGPRTLTLRLRNNLREENNRGAIIAEWSFPITPRVKGFVHYFEGFGESLIEYNHYQKRLGIGFKVSDYL